MTTTGRRMVSAILTAGLALASGCTGGEGDSAESVQGQWSSIEPIDQSHNELLLEEGGQGEATVYIHRTVNNKPEASPFDFEVTWEQDEGEIQVELLCTSSPFGQCEPDDDIFMECDLSPSMTMDCEADGRWRDYDFRWQKN